MNANVEQGTVKELLTLFTQEGAATYKATLFVNADGVFASAETHCGLERGSW